jgi:hypothetical protein
MYGMYVCIRVVVYLREHVLSEPVANRVQDALGGHENKPLECCIPIRRE